MSALVSYRLRKLLQRATNPAEERDAYRRAYLDLLHTRPPENDPPPVVAHGACGTCAHLHPLSPTHGLCAQVVRDGHVVVTHGALEVAHTMSCGSYAPTESVSPVQR